jgi:hypothetical protein
MTTDYQLQSEECRDLEAEFIEANEAYERWLLELPRESCGVWNEADDVSLSLPPF